LSGFLTRPISAACLILAVLLLLSAVLPALRRKRDLVALEDGS
jgi:putative tricarboxylic transport membrane protein